MFYKNKFILSQNREKSLFYCCCDHFLLNGVNSPRKYNVLCFSYRQQYPNDFAMAFCFTDKFPIFAQLTIRIMYFDLSLFATKYEHIFLNSMLIDRVLFYTI